MSDFPRTQIEDVSLPRLLIGTNLAQSSRGASTVELQRTRSKAGIDGLTVHDTIAARR